MNQGLGGVSTNTLQSFEPEAGQLLEARPLQRFGPEAGQSFDGARPLQRSGPSIWRQPNFTTEKSPEENFGL